jgi:beta-lactamase regulating signal transducer with metallopeptidase domain
MLEELFLTVLNMSLTASYVILFVILARLPLKRAPQIIPYALWIVVAFRLVCPFSFESIFSLMPQNTSPLYMASPSTPQINSGPGNMDAIMTGTLSAPVVEAGITPLPLYAQIGAYIWITGIAVMLIYSVVSVMILKRRLKNAKLTDTDIYEADNLKTPFVLGFIRPKIYIPAGLGEEERRYILLHEQTHVRRRDHFIKPFAFLVLSLHWFNPLVWIGFLLMSTDMELSCDEKVLKEMGAGIKKSYAASLLSLATGRRILTGSPLAFGEGNVKGRIKNVLSYKKPGAWVIVAAVALAAALGIGLAANRSTAAAGDYDFTSFSVNGFMLGADISEIDTSTLTPAEPLQAQEGYDFNFEEVRYSADEYTGRLRKVLVNVYDGAYIPSVIIHKDEGPIYIPHNLNTIEQVINVFGPGKSGWQDREQRLRYMEYRQQEGRLSATVRFVYTDGISDRGTNHHLVWVIAESSLPYPSSAQVSTAEPITFSSAETDLKRLGTIAFDTYMAFRMSPKTPVEERVASYQLNDISVLAGDIKEFCVSLNYDFTTDNDGFISPGHGAKGKGTWPDNYMEIRVKYAYDDVYAIKSIGTGGGGQGLEPYAPSQTALEPAVPELSLEQTVGADMAELDYASDDIVIFHGYFGLFVYDLDSLRIIRSLDLKPLNCHYTQGDDYCEVSVSRDGNTVQLHPVSSKNMYVYTVSSNTLRETAYQPMKERFGSRLVPIENAVGSNEIGSYSVNAVKFDTGEYGYLYTYDWTLRTLSYVRDDMMHSLFGIEN